MIKVIVLCTVVWWGCSFASSEKKTDDSFKLETTGFVSAYAVDLDNGEVVLEHNSNKRLTPASLTKIFTTAAAMDLLKSDYQFKTQFLVASRSL